MRTKLVVAGLLVAWLAEPSQAGRSEADAVGDYNNTLVEIAGDVTERIEDAQERFGHLEPGLRFDAWRSTSLEAVHNGLQQLDAVAPRVDDEGFRAAVRDGLTTSERVIDVIITEGFALSSKEAVANADLARFEALYAELAREAERVDSGIRRTQRAFARSHHMRLIDPKQRKREPLPDFKAPGIPPQESRLPGQVHVSFAVRYGNALVAEQNALSSASAAVMQAEQRELDGAREQALGEVREILARIERAELWQGDDTLRAGALAMARELDASLAGPTAEYAKLAQLEALEEDEFERANALVGEMNDASKRAHEAFTRAEAAFRAHWAIDAYQVWARAREAEERVRSERRARDEQRGEKI